MLLFKQQVKIILLSAHVFTACDSNKMQDSKNKIESTSTEKSNKVDLTDEEQIHRATDWYFQILKLEQTDSKNTLCKETTWNTTENKKSFQQKSKKCSFSNDFQLITCDLDGWEWEEKIMYYMKNNTVFYVLEEVTTLAGKALYKIYYDEKGKVIRILESSRNEFSDITTKNEVVKEEKKKKKILSIINQNLSESLKHLN